MKQRVWTLVAVLGVILLGVGGYASVRAYNQIVVKANLPPVPKTPIEPTVTPTPDPLIPYSILLMGYGGGTHEGGKLTDSMMLVRIEPRKAKITLISIPRDLWVPLPIDGENTKNFKINAAYAIGSDDKGYPNKSVQFTGKAGGGEMAKKVVEGVVGFKVDYFAALDFAGFEKVVDTLGGIDVNVLRAFDDPWYPIESDTINNCGLSDETVAALTATMSGEKLEQQFPCRYENLHFEKGINHMDGVTALKYARSRHSPSDGGDFNRAARQRQIILAVKEKVLSIDFIPKIIPTINTLKWNLTTDIDLTEMNKLLGEADTLAKYKIVSVALTNDNVLKDGISEDGQYILEPKAGPGVWDEVRQFIDNPTMLTPSP